MRASCSKFPLYFLEKKTGGYTEEVFGYRDCKCNLITAGPVAVKSCLFHRGCNQVPSLYKIDYVPNGLYRSVTCFPQPHKAAQRVREKKNIDNHNSPAVGMLRRRPLLRKIQRVCRRRPLFASRQQLAARMLWIRRRPSEREILLAAPRRSAC